MAQGPRHTPLAAPSLLALALLACGGDASDGARSATPAVSAQASTASPTPSPSTPASSAGEAAPSASIAEGPRSSLLGRWVSPACGVRKYERQLSFEEGGRFASLEMISPCPPGARCVWSGIVQRLGRYELKGTRVTLVVDPPVDEHGVPLPESVEFDGRVVERAPDGSACEYAYRP